MSRPPADALLCQVIRPPQANLLRDRVVAGSAWTKGRTAWWLASGAVDVTAGEPAAVVATLEAPPFFEKASSAALIAWPDGGLRGLVTFATHPPLVRSFDAQGRWLADLALPPDRTCWIAGISADGRHAVLEGWPDNARGRRRPRTNWDIANHCASADDPGPVRLPPLPEPLPSSPAPSAATIASPTPLAIGADYEPANTYDTADVFNVFAEGCAPLRLDWRPEWAYRCGEALALWSARHGLTAVAASGALGRARGELPVWPAAAPPTVLPSGQLALQDGCQVACWQAEPAGVAWCCDLGRRVRALHVHDGELRVADDGGVSGVALASGHLLWHSDTRPSGDVPIRLDGELAFGIRGAELRIAKAPPPPKSEPASRVTPPSQRRGWLPLAALVGLAALASVAAAWALWGRAPEQAFDPLDGSGVPMLACQDYAADRADGTRATLQQAVHFWRDRQGHTANAQAILAATGRQGPWGQTLAVHLLIAAARDATAAKELGPATLRQLTGALQSAGDLPLAGQRALAGLALTHPGWFASPQAAITQWQSQLSAAARTALAPLGGPLPPRLRLEAPERDRPVLTAWLAAVGSAIDPTATMQLTVQAADRQVDRVETVREVVTTTAPGAPTTRLLGRHLQTERPLEQKVEQRAAGTQVVHHPVRWLQLALRDLGNPDRPPAWHVELPDRLLWLDPGEPELSDWSSETRCGGWLWGTEAAWLLGPALSL